MCFSSSPGKGTVWLKIMKWLITLTFSDGQMKLHESLSLVHKRVNFWRLKLLTIPPGGQRV